MNLVTSGNGTISLTTFIVGFVLLAPNSNVRSSVRFVVMMLRRPPTDKRVAPRAKCSHSELTTTRPEDSLGRPLPLVKVPSSEQRTLRAGSNNCGHRLFRHDDDALLTPKIDGDRRR